MKKLKCGFKTRQCGGRCVPVTMRCGGNHSAAEIKATVEAIEDEIKDKSVEHLCTIDSKTGEVLEKNIGDRTSVGIDRTDLIKGNIVTHNHPALTNNTRSEYYKGNSFSPQDVLIASAFEAKEMRAVTNTYRHSIKPGGKEWPSQETLTKSYNRHHHAVANEMRNDVFWGKRTLDHANANFWHEVTKRVARDTGMRYSRATLKGDRADAYNRGFLYAVRNDRGQLKCKPGNKPCGGRCVPIKYKCKEEQGLRQEESQTNPTPPQGLSTAAKVAAFAGGAIVTAGAAGAIAAQWAVGEVKKAKTDPDQFFFPKSEEDIAKVNEEYDKLEPGDLIHRAFKLNDDYFEHYAVYGGKDENGKHTVFQVGKPTPQGLDPAVQHEAIDEKDGMSAYKKVPDDRMYKKGTANFTREEIVGRAKTLVGKNIDYKVTSQNCENWARAIVEGTGYTTQGERSNGFVKAAGDIVTNVMASKVAKERESLGSMLDYLHQEAKQWRSPSFWEHKDLFTDTAKTDADTPPSGSGVLVSPADFAKRVDELAKGSLADTIRTQLYSHYFQLVLALSQPKSMANSDSYDRAYRVSVRNDRTLAKKLKCGFKTRQCGGRCVPVTMRCGGNHSAAEIKATVEAIENEIKDKDTSQAYVIDSKTGEVKDLSHGNRFSRNTRHIPNKGNIVTRNSPRFGTGIGSEDIIMAIEDEVKESRVVTKTHRHSLKPSNGEWPSRDDLTRSFDHHWGRVQRERDSAVFWGKIPEEKAETFFWHELTKRVASDTGMIYSRTHINDDRADSYDRAYRVSVRNDRGTVKCKPGFKACGGRCVPVKFKCKNEKESAVKPPSKNGMSKYLPTIAVGGATAAAAVMGVGGYLYATDPKGWNVALQREYSELSEKAGIRKLIPSVYNKIEKADLDANLAKGKRIKSDLPPSPFNRNIKVFSKNYLLDIKFAEDNKKKAKELALNHDEVAAIRQYARPITYSWLNSILRDDDAGIEKAMEQVNKIEVNAFSDVETFVSNGQIQIDTITNGLKKMPPYLGQVYRGLELPTEVIENLIHTKKWHEKGFMSTTKNFAGAYPGNTFFSIKSRDGKDISSIEPMPNHEVLFKPGTKLEVTSYRQVNKLGKTYFYFDMIESTDKKSDSYDRAYRVSVRNDRGTVKCKPGNKPCGGRCVPIKYKCKDEKSSLAQTAPSEPMAPSPVTSGRTLRNPLIALAGVMQANGVATATATALGAATIGIVADVNRSMANPKDYHFTENGKADQKALETYDTFSKGDLIEKVFKLPTGYARHFAIYAGKDEKTGQHMVYEVGNPKQGWKINYAPIDGEFVTKDVSTYRRTPADQMYKAKDSKIRNPKDILRDAEAMVGKEFDYHLMTDNCETWARSIVEGTGYSLQGSATTKFTRAIVEMATYDKKTNKGRASLEYVVKNTLQHDKTGATEALFPAATKADSIDENLPEGLQDPESFAKGVETIVKESGTMGSRVKSMLYAKYLEIIIMSQVLPQLKQDSIRYDRLIKCKPGNKPCGDRCIPARFKCRGKGVKQDEPKPPTSKSLPESSPRPLTGKSSSVGGTAIAIGFGVTGTAAVVAGAAIGASMLDVRATTALPKPIARIAPYDKQTEAAYDQFEPGDLVERSFGVPGIGHLQHFAIYAGKTDGEHYFYSQNTTGTFQKEKGSVEKGIFTSEYVKVKDNKGVAVDKATTLKRAEAMLGTALDHHGIENTCENLARGLARDDWKTNQAANVNGLTRAVAPVVAKTLTLITSLKEGTPSIRLNTKEMQLWLAKREEGASFQEAKQHIFEFRKTGRTDSESDRFFDVANIQTPEEFVAQSVKDFGKIPGEIGRKVYEDRVKRYLMLILATCIASTTNDRTDAFVSKDKATLSLAQKQLSTIVYRIVSRSYRNPIDRFLSLNIVSPTSIAGAILSRGSTIAFVLNLEKETLETRIVKEGRQDAVRRSGNNKCETGFSCGTTCITKKKTCKISLSKLATQPEVRQVKQLAVFLKEETSPFEAPEEPKSIRELKKIAAAKGVYKYSRMNRAELIDNIKSMEGTKEERYRKERTLARKSEAEKFTTNNALSDYAKDWNNAKKIIKIAGSGGALTIAAAAMYFYGRTQAEIKKAEDKYREGFAEMAVQAEARSTRVEPEYKKPIDKDGIIFAVGGYDGEGSSGDKLADEIKAMADADDGTNLKWLATENEIKAFNLKKQPPDFSGRKFVSGDSGEYTTEYKGYLANNAVKGRLGDRGLLNPVFTSLLGKEHEVPRNEDAIELAAQIYAVARAKNTRPDINEMDTAALTSAYEKYMGASPPPGVKDGDLRITVDLIRRANGEGDPRFANKEKPISILAHGAGGGTAREALEIIRKMPGGDLIARRVNLVTLSSPRMGLTESISKSEKNLTTVKDPFHSFQNARVMTVSGVKDREISSYMENSTVRDFIAQSFEYSHMIERKETVSKLIESEMARLSRLATPPAPASPPPATPAAPRRPRPTPPSPTSPTSPTPPTPPTPSGRTRIPPGVIGAALRRAMGGK